MDEITLLTAKETSILLRTPLSTLYRLTKSEQINGFKVGKQWRYKKEDILHYFNSGINFENMQGFSQDFKDKIKDATGNDI